LNFLIITFDFPPKVGGIQTRAKNYIKNLTERQYKIITVALSPRKDIRVHSYEGTTVYRCPASPKLVFQTFFTIVNVIERNSIDAIHVLTGANTLIGLFSLIYGKIKKIRTGIFLYGKEILISKSSPLQRIILRLALLLADKIGVNSKATSKLLPKGAENKVHILYPGVDVQTIKQFRIPRVASKSGRKVLFVGRLIKRKGVDDLLHAFKLVIEKIPDAELVIVGDGPEKTMLLNMAKALGVHDRVRFTGTLTGKKLYSKYQGCDVFVMPSKRIDDDVEGFGMVFLEAGLFKKPSVGTWSGGIPEAVIHEETGILVPEEDINALAKVLTLLLINRDLSEKLGKNAYRRVMKEFTWEKVTSELVKMYQDD